MMRSGNACRHQTGLTLLEVLVAMSLFAVIGVASFQVLSSVIETQKVGDQHSQTLAAFQNTLTIIDRDLQQVVDRPVRTGPDEIEPGLRINTGNYPLEITRGGWPNPLLLQRSRLQRVAYDLGKHPQSTNPDSAFYGDSTVYLRRMFWPQLDRYEDVEPLIQVLLADVDELEVSILTDKGVKNLWPLEQSAAEDMPEPKVLEFSFNSSILGVVSRAYKLELYTPADE